MDVQPSVIPAPQLDLFPLGIVDMKNEDNITNNLNQLMGISHEPL